MNILYLGYWSINEGLSHAAIFPHLILLSSFQRVKSIHYVSIERDREKEIPLVNISKCVHHPLFSLNISLPIINKFVDYNTFPKALKKIIKENKVDLCIGAGTHAGALLYITYKNTNVPFIVSYYDPHADYMRVLRIWKKCHIRYIMLHHWEKQLKKHAKAIFAVSEKYRNALINDGVNVDRVYMVPCATDLTQFVIDDSWTISTRDKLKWRDNDIVGIYVGKFGDIYYEDEAFELFKALKKAIPDFKIIILSSAKKEWIIKKLISVGFSKEEFFIGLVAHSEVPKYLNAADVAFCLHRPHEYSFAYSPIKNGEYWACGLPVIIADNIGDDSSIIKETGLGIVLKDIRTIDESVVIRLQTLLKKDKNEFRQLAFCYRNPEVVQNAYQRILTV